MVSTVWSVSCLLYFTVPSHLQMVGLGAPRAQPFVNVEGARARAYGVGATDSMIYEIALY